MTVIMFRWFIYNLILRHPTTSKCLLAIIVIGIFSVMIGWPAYVFLGTCVLALIVYCCISSKVKPIGKRFNDRELYELERKNRWIMGVLSVFALSGIVVSMHLTISCLKYAANTSSIIGTMALFHFILIGIPYILMNMVIRKNGFWYGLICPVLLAAIIQFFIFSLFAESDSRTIVRYTSGEFERLKGNWLIICPLLFAPIYMFLNSLGKAFGFKVDDDTYNIGYDKEKHKQTIIIDKRKSLIGMTISIIWSILSIIYCYFYVNSL